MGAAALAAIVLARPLMPESPPRQAPNPSCPEDSGELPDLLWQSDGRYNLVIRAANTPGVLLIGARGERHPTSLSNARTPCCWLPMPDLPISAAMRPSLHLVARSNRTQDMKVEARGAPATTTPHGVFVYSCCPASFVHVSTIHCFLCFAQDADVEMVARGAGDCWVAGRVAGPRSLVVVMEGRGEGGLQV